MTVAKVAAKMGCCSLFNSEKRGVGKKIVGGVNVAGKTGCNSRKAQGKMV